MDKTKIAVAVFDKLAGLYQQKFMDVTLYSDSLHFFCNKLNPTAEILELACGPGNITQYVLQQQPGFKILGTDLSPNMIALAKANNPSAQFELLDCRDIAKISKTYNGILCGFCLPYLDKEETIQFIGDAAKLLTPGGLLYISTMEDEYSKSGFKKGSTGDEVFMHYHEEHYLAKAFEESHLKIVYTERKEYPGPDGTVTKDLIMIGKKL